MEIKVIPFLGEDGAMNFCLCEPQFASLLEVAIGALAMGSFGQGKSIVVTHVYETIHSCSGKIVVIGTGEQAWFPGIREDKAYWDVNKGHNVLTTSAEGFEKVWNKAYQPGPVAEVRYGYDQPVATDSEPELELEVIRFGGVFGSHAYVLCEKRHASHMANALEWSGVNTAVNPRMNKPIDINTCVVYQLPDTGVKFVVLSPSPLFCGLPGEVIHNVSPGTGMRHFTSSKEESLVIWNYAMNLSGPDLNPGKIEEPSNGAEHVTVAPEQESEIEVIEFTGMFDSYGYCLCEKADMAFIKKHMKVGGLTVIPKPLLNKTISVNTYMVYQHTSGSKFVVLSDARHMCMLPGRLIRDVLVSVGVFKFTPTETELRSVWGYADELCKRRYDLIAMKKKPAGSIADHLAAIKKLQAEIDKHLVEIEIISKQQ